MPFDPDAYLASKGGGGGFDPDAYLASKTPAPRKMGVGEMLLNHPITQAVVGTGEAALEMGTGAAAQVLGGYHGLGKTAAELLKGKSFDEATSAGAEAVRETGERGVYRPQLETGKALSKAVAYLPEKATEGWRQIGGAIGETVGGEKGRIAGEELGGAGFQALATVAPAPVALKKARAAAGPTAYEQAAATYPDRPAPAVGPTAEEIARVDNAAKVEAAKKAQQYGIAYDVGEVNPNIPLKEKFKRETTLPQIRHEELTRANEGKVENILKESVGIDRMSRLTPESIEMRREQLAGPKNQITSMDGFVDDGRTVAEIRQLVPERTVGMGNEHELAVRRVNEIINDIQQGSGSGQWVMSSIESLRKAARDIYNSTTDLTPEKRNTAEIYKGTADAIERLIERKLETSNPQLLNEYRQNRQVMAQTYLLEDVLDRNTGKVDVNKLARRTRDDGGITGAFRDIGEIVGNLPESFSVPSKESLFTRYTRQAPSGLIGAALGSAILPGLGSAAGLGAGVLAGRALGHRFAKKAASPEYQQQFGLPGYVGARERLGYGPAETVEALRLAPKDEVVPMGGTGGAQVAPAPAAAIPSYEGGIPFNIGLADMPPEVAALRGAEMRLGSQDVPQPPNPNVPALMQKPATPGQAAGPTQFVPPEQGMEFKMPIEKASEVAPVYQQLIEQYKQQAENAPNWADRQFALQQVKEMEQMLSDALRQEGLASNLQLLYGEGAGFPIEKAPMFRSQGGIPDMIPFQPTPSGAAFEKAKALRDFR